MGPCMSSAAEDKFAGNTKDAVAFMLIEYCGGWGYLKHAKKLMAEIDAKHENKYMYKLHKDAGTTERFEVTLMGSKDELTASTT